MKLPDYRIGLLAYLVDRRGDILQAYLGALAWDTPENIAIIQNLLEQG
ncbi:MAG: hypothetical protein GWP56_00055 [Gammaproteobacteria bacterium]|jgi:hypothetical protein|nr:hypothetical protein [Gammaproteobacteria bacterium]